MNRIAIIGSGISGLTFAWLAQRAGCQVALFESQATLGMDAHSIDLSLSVAGREPQQVRADVPPRMFNREDWPLLSQLYDWVGVESQAVDASKSFATEDRSSWLQLGDQYRGGFSAAALLSSKTRGVAAETARLQAAVTAESIADFPHELTLGTYLSNEKYSDDFVFDFLFPGLAATVLTCSYEALSNYPAKIALMSLLNQVDRSPLRRTKNGTADVVSRLSADLQDIRFSSKVATVKRDGESVIVVGQDGASSNFDQLVIATQANSASRLLGNAPALARERSILDSFEYEDVPVVVHRDESFMPQKQSHRKCFNFISQDDRSDAMCTIWLNRFYPEWPDSVNVYQTIRPLRQPADGSVIAAAAMQRPVVNRQTLKAVQELGAMNEADSRIWFVGSYAAASVPLLESGVASAFDAARKLGIDIPSDLIAAPTA